MSVAQSTNDDLRSHCALHDFDLMICGQVISNVRLNADEPHIRTAIAGLAPPLSGLILDATIEDLRLAPVPAVLLNEDELDDIAGVLQFLPLTATRLWLPSQYETATLCTGEIRRRLAPAEASRWANSATQFIERLHHPHLELAEGIDVVNQWTHELRRYLEALSEFQFLPRPAGHFPTPTHPEPGKSVGAISPELAYVERMRAAIAQHQDGTKAAPDELIKSAHANRQLARSALRILEQRGEYHGFARGSIGNTAK